MKIIDFGLSKILSGSMAKSFLGTRVRRLSNAAQPWVASVADWWWTLVAMHQGYLAPEMLQRQTYSKTIDVWALGVVSWARPAKCGRTPAQFGVRVLTVSLGWGSWMRQIVFVLLCGCLPFDDDSSKMSSESVQQKFQLRFPSWASNLSSGAKDLLIHLLGTSTNHAAVLTTAHRLTTSLSTSSSHWPCAWQTSTPALATRPSRP